MIVSYKRKDRYIHIKTTSKKRYHIIMNKLDVIEIKFNKLKNMFFFNIDVFYDAIC
jgi:hypothetical protein